MAIRGRFVKKGQVKWHDYGIFYPDNGPSYWVMRCKTSNQDYPDSITVNVDSYDDIKERIQQLGGELQKILLEGANNQKVHVPIAEFERRANEQEPFTVDNGDLIWRFEFGEFDPSLATRHEYVTVDEPQQAWPQARSRPNNGRPQAQRERIASLQEWGLDDNAKANTIMEKGRIARADIIFHSYNGTFEIVPWPNT